MSSGIQVIHLEVKVCINDFAAVWNFGKLSAN